MTLRKIYMSYILYLNVQIGRIVKYIFIYLFVFTFKNEGKMSTKNSKNNYAKAKFVIEYRFLRKNSRWIKYNIFNLKQITDSKFVITISQFVQWVCYLINLFQGMLCLYICLYIYFIFMFVRAVVVVIFFFINEAFSPTCQRI